jgi:hypothetical protein
VRRPSKTLRFIFALLILLGVMSGLGSPATAGEGTGCWIQSVTPWGTQSGVVIGKARDTCDIPEHVPYRKLRAELQFRPDGGRWRTLEKGVDEGTPEQIVYTLRMTHSCKPGQWRVLVTGWWFRWSETDPWTLAHGRLIGPFRDLERCPR